MVAVTVFGASGRTGRLIVETALTQGHDVIAAVRQPGQFAHARTSWSGPGRLTVLQADVHNPDTVDAAVRNSQAVISSIGTGRKPHNLYSAGTATIIDAMRRTDVRRLICISSGASRNDDRNIPFWYRRIISPLFMNELYKDMAHMEDIVRESTLDWILVRPAQLRDIPPHPAYRIEDGTNPRGGHQTSRQDLAEFCVAQITADIWLRRAPTMAK